MAVWNRSQQSCVQTLTWPGRLCSSTNLPSLSFASLSCERKSVRTLGKDSRGEQKLYMQVADAAGRVTNTPLLPCPCWQSESSSSGEEAGREPHLAFSLLVLQRGIQQHDAWVLDVAPHSGMGHVFVNHDSPQDTRVFNDAPRYLSKRPTCHPHPRAASSQLPSQTLGSPARAHAGF